MSDPRRCPLCQGPSRVVDVRPTAGWGAKRRRACAPDEPERPPCPVRWTTYERRGRVDYLECDVADEEKTQPVVPPPAKAAPKS